MSIEALVVIIVALVIYVLPSLIADNRKHYNFKAILAVNILTGWTGFGWIAALVWALTNNVRPRLA